MPQVSQPSPRAPLTPIIVALIIVGVVAYWSSQHQQPVESGPPGTIPLEVSDPSTLEQNGQPLANDGSVPGTQPLQQTQSVDQSPESSNLQGSPSTQQAAPADSIPSDWLK